VKKRKSSLASEGEDHGRWEELEFAPSMNPPV